ERSLRMCIAGLFQAATALLTLESSDGPAISLLSPVISLGWPVRLIEVLVRRSETEPQLLVPAARLCLEAVRSFVTEMAHRGRSLELPQLWRVLLQLLLRAAPTTARALWPSTKDKEVETVQLQLWRRGLVWLLGHPQLQDAPPPSLENGVLNERGGPNDTEANNFWSWSLTELNTLAHEMASGSRPGATRLLLDSYSLLLGRLGREQSAEEYAKEEPRVEVVQAVQRSLSGPVDAAGVTERATSSGSSCRSYGAKEAAWSRVAVSLLNYVGPILSRPSNDEIDAQILPLLKQTLLHAHVPSLLVACPHGSHWARCVLEKLVSVLTGPVTSGAPLPVVRDAVSLVAKFFLQNLQCLQR
ncbi:unnamed protein product, partial [Polarella glacialis]